jgi:hypothetical protein
MQVVSVDLRRQESYEKNPGDLIGSVKFDTPMGEVTLGLTPYALRKIEQFMLEEADMAADHLKKPIGG